MSNENFSELFRFLKEHKAYTAFIKNLTALGHANTEAWTNVVKKNPLYAIGSAFTWRLTPQGESYWFGLHHKWRLELEKEKWKRENTTKTSTF